MPWELDREWILRKLGQEKLKIASENILISETTSFKDSFLGGVKGNLLLVVIATEYMS